MRALGWIHWIQQRATKLRLARRPGPEVGQGTLEYVLILVMIVIFVIGILIFFRDDIEGWIDQLREIMTGWFNEVESEITSE